MRVRPLILEVSKLRVQRGATLILKDISWRVGRGENWVIFGPNGSGKTSLLSALTGYLTPSAGEIRVLGRKYGHWDWRELRKQIGLVSSSVRQMMAPDEPALESIISGKEALIDFRGHYTSSDRSRAVRLLEQIDCAHLRDRPWGVLSQGERQRILIGRALMAKPRLLILDEPCAGLDPAAREHFLDFIDRLGRKQTAPSLVLVTHHLEEIKPVFSHAMLLKRGEVLAQGETARVLTSRLLSRAFDTPMRVRKDDAIYNLRLPVHSRHIL